MVKRRDVGEMRKPERLPSGMLRADAWLTRTGVFNYRDDDGSIVRELRHPDEVMAQASLATLAMVPLTLEHPAEMVTAANAKKHQVGSVGESIVPEGDRVRSTLMVNDHDAVQAVLSGKASGVSCGYECNLDFTPGVFEGQAYDAVQRDIAYNHVALTGSPRLGPDIAVKLDSAGVAHVDVPTPTVPRKDSAPMLHKFTVDGITFEATEQGVQAHNAVVARLDAAVKKLEGEAAAAKAEAAKQAGRADQLDEKLKAAQKAHADATAPAALSKLVTDRVALVDQARAVLGADVKLDALDALSIKKLVVQKVSPSAVLDGKEPAYIEARYDQAVEGAGNAALGDLRRDASAAQGDGKAVVDSYAKHAEESRNAWKQKIPGAV